MNEMNVRHNYSNALGDCKNFRFQGRSTYLEGMGRLYFLKIGLCIKWDKVFKSDLSKICGSEVIFSNILKATFPKFYSVHSCTLCPKCFSSKNTG